MMTEEQIDEIRARAETRLAATPKADTLALLDEVERLRARLREADAEVDRVRKHLRDRRATNEPKTTTKEAKR